MWYWKDFVRTLIFVGVLIGLAGCEENVKTDPGRVNQNRENLPVEPVKETSPFEEGSPIEPNTPEEDIITAVELDPQPGPVADNNLCFACHVNFKKETLTSVHAQANVGCTRCHGSSVAHSVDEDTITPPDVMFPKTKITLFCMSCHIEDSVNIPVHETVMAEADPLKAYCTDCHGEHRLNYRTRIWDKRTRNLIKDGRVLRLSDEIFEQR